MIYARVTLVSALLMGTAAYATPFQTAPDNTKTNQRDRNSDQATADKQKMNAADRDLTAKIRKAVLADKSLSTYAHNIKIISQNGVVTLKGPVHSDEEIRSLMAKAAEVAGGPEKVVNQLAVK
jgi:osmotically-inducible protein OsmY